MKILNVTDGAFRKYGRVISDIDFSGLLEKMEKTTPVPEDVVYVPSVPELEALPVFGELTEKTYGELPVQIGYCNGHNLKLNALEYHRSSEIDIAVNDLVLMLGWQPDITDDFTYDTSKVELFLVPAGTAVELYATTLHYAPCAGEGLPVRGGAPEGHQPGFGRCPCRRGRRPSDGKEQVAVGTSRGRSAGRQPHGTGGGESVPLTM